MGTAAAKGWPGNGQENRYTSHQAFTNNSPRFSSMESTIP
jgi:hypothetical protein